MMRHRHRQLPERHLDKKSANSEKRGVANKRMLVIGECTSMKAPEPHMLPLRKQAVQLTQGLDAGDDWSWASLGLAGLRHAAPKRIRRLMQGTCTRTFVIM